MRRCMFEKCMGKHHARGFCGSHYARLLRNGDPLLHTKRVVRGPRRHRKVGIRDYEILRLLAHGEPVDVDDIAYLLHITAAAIRQSVYRIRLNYGYDAIVTDKSNHTLRLKVALPGYKKHKKLLMYTG